MLAGSALRAADGGPGRRSHQDRGLEGDLIRSRPPLRDGNSTISARSIAERRASRSTSRPMRRDRSFMHWQSNPMSWWKISVPRNARLGFDYAP
jgi:hypothetical protein